MSELSFTMPDDHPSLPGHFPGCPLVPGVALLDAVLARIGPVATLPAVRFTAPVRPGETVTFEWRETGDRVTFAAHVAGRPVLRGTARRRGA